MFLSMTARNYPHRLLPNSEFDILSDAELFALLAYFTVAENRQRKAFSVSQVNSDLLHAAIYERSVENWELRIWGLGF